MNLINVQQINKISYNANIYESMHILTHKKKKVLKALKTIHSQTNIDVCWRFPFKNLNFSVPDPNTVPDSFKR